MAARSRTILVFGTGLLAVGVLVALLFLSHEAPAGPRVEREELPVPTMTPDSIPPNEKTVVRFTVKLPDPNYKYPRLEVFDPELGDWSYLGSPGVLLDNGKLADDVKGDRIFNRELTFLDSDGTTQIIYVRLGGAEEVIAEVPSPAELRLIAERKDDKTVLAVSAPFLLTSWQIFDEPSLGIHFFYPSTWAVRLGTNEFTGTVSSVRIQGPEGSALVISPDGEYSYGVEGDEILEVSRTHITLAGHPVVRRDFVLAPTSEPVFSRFEFDIQDRPNFRIDALYEDTAELPIIELILDSLYIGGV